MQKLNPLFLENHQEHNLNFKHHFDQVSIYILQQGSHQEGVV